MVREFHLVSIYSCHRRVNIIGWNHLMTFTPSTRYCPVRHSPSFTIPQLSPIGRTDIDTIRTVLSMTIGILRKRVYSIRFTSYVEFNHCDSPNFDQIRVRFGHSSVNQNIRCMTYGVYAFARFPYRGFARRNTHLYAQDLAPLLGFLLYGAI